MSQITRSNKCKITRSRCEVFHAAGVFAFAEFAPLFAPLITGGMTKKLADGAARRVLCVRVLWDWAEVWNAGRAGQEKRRLAVQ